jgi:hypothetical protein
MVRRDMAGLVQQVQAKGKSGDGQVATRLSAAAWCPQRSSPTFVEGRHRGQVANLQQPSSIDLRCPIRWQPKDGYEAYWSADRGVLGR